MCGRNNVRNALEVFMNTPNPRRKLNNVAVPPTPPDARPGNWQWVPVGSNDSAQWNIQNPHEHVRETKSRRWSTTCSHIRRSETLAWDNESLADDVCHKTQTKAGLWSHDMLSHLGQSWIYCVVFRRPDVPEEIC